MLVLAKAPRDTDDTPPEGRDFPVADPESDVPIPSPTPSDPEDVSWALSTAEAMWARGDIAEAVKWLRRGAEAASEAEADERALELAKAAANLSARLPRRSTPAAAGQGSSAAALLEATPQGAALSPTPLRRGSSLPPQPGATPPRGVVAARSSPPSQGPLLGGSAAPSQPPRSGAPLPLASSARASSSHLPPATSPPRPKSVPVPLSALESGRFAAHDLVDPPDAPRVSEGRVRLATQPDAEHTSPGVDRFDDPTSDHFNPPKSEGRSDVAQESEEPWAPPPPSSRPPPRARMATSENTAQMPALTELNAIEVLRGRRPLKALASLASDWDAAPTKTLSNADLSNLDRSRVPVVIEGEAAPKSEANVPLSQPPPSGRSEDRRTEDRRAPLATSQAVRVVLWKDANGVHVAPQGTRVSAITVDVMVVALDPSADIRAWLDPEHRKGSQ
jgi:hypothetical protein